MFSGLFSSIGGLKLDLIKTSEYDEYPIKIKVKESKDVFNNTFSFTCEYLIR